MESNILYPIDLSIFKDHIKLSFLNIIESVFNNNIVAKEWESFGNRSKCIKEIEFLSWYEIADW